jgi:pectate lyase
MKKCNFFYNQWFKLPLSLMVTVLVALQLYAQAPDECTSFGWANFDGQTEKEPVTGGGTGTPLKVTTFSALKSAVESSAAQVIHVMNNMGNGYVGKSGDVLNFKSNKTVLGVKPGITIKCSVQIKGASNIIIRNLIIRGPGNSNSNQNWDAVTVQQGAKRVWFDHCTVMEGEDGNFDVVKGSDNVTASWCKFCYVSGGEHNLSNLVGSSDDEPQSHGKLNITYAYCWWDNVNSRCPRTRYGKIHVLNCYYNNVGSGVYAGKMSNIRVEGCFFESNVKNPTGLISTNGQAGVFVIDCNRGTTQKDGYNSVFVPPYEYKKYSNSEVKSLVTKQAGATLSDPTRCGATGITSEMYQNVGRKVFIPAQVTDILKVQLELQQGDELLMCLLDLSGREVAVGRTGTATGSTTASFDLSKVGPGVYIVKLRAGALSMTRRTVKTNRP